MLVLDSFDIVHGQVAVGDDHVPTSVARKR
jgi:hypothetical protein